MRQARALVLLAAFSCGALLALQSRLNGTLSAHSGRPVIAALWSFGSGLVLLTAIALGSARVRRGVRDLPRAIRDGRLRWYQCLGGVAGGLLVATQTYSVPIIGVAIFSVAALAGQTLSGLGVDRLGWGSGGKHPVSPARVGFALLGLLGVVVSASGQGADAGQVAVLPVVLCVLVGGAVAVQQGINARVNRAVGQPLATTWQNFLLGCGVLLIVALCSAVAQPGSWDLPTGAPWWSWFGALCGIAFIAMTAWAVHELGVLVFGLVSVAGQLLTALGLDLLDPAVRPGVGGGLVAGVVISLVAAGGAGIVAARGR